MKKNMQNKGMRLAAAGAFFLLTTPCLAGAKSSQKEELKLLRQQAELLQQQNQQLNQRFTDMETRQKKQAQAGPAHVDAEHQSVIEKKVARQLEGKGGGIPKISDHVKLSGLIEGDYILDENFGGTNGSEFDLATLELYLDIMVNKWATGRIVIEYDSDEDKLRIDEGYVTLGNTEEFPLFASIGRLYMPFGTFETNMLQDPLTQLLGETNDEGLVIGLAYQGFAASAFAYNGMDKNDPDDDTINGFGFSLAYSYENEEEEKAFNAGAAWISNIADSVEMSDVVRDNIRAHLDAEHGPLSNEVSAMALYMNGKWGPWSAITEYVRALDSFAAWEFGYGRFIDEDDEALGRIHGAEPAALNLEFAYTTAIKDIETVFALGYQRSWEAVALELPEHRYIGTVSFVIFEGTILSFEYYYDKDYSEGNGGTDNNGHGFTTRLAYEF